MKEAWLEYIQNGIDSVTRQPDAAAADRSNNDNADAIADNDIALEEREREQQGIVIDSVAEHPFYAFDILNPPNLVRPHDYLGDHLQQIHEEINNSETANTIRNSGLYNLKVWAWSTSHYSRITENNPTLATGGPRPTLPSQEGIEIMHSNTVALRIQRHGHPNEIVTLRDLATLNRDLADRFYKAKDQLYHSGWSYLKTTDIRICFVSYHGRPVRKVTPPP